jgi:hypothetical protein
VELAPSHEDVVVCYELGLVGLYAGLSKAFRPRKVVSLIEGTTSISAGRARRRSRSPYAGSQHGSSMRSWRTASPRRNYLLGTLNVPERKIVVGWWLAGIPPGLRPALPRAPPPVPDGVPLFVCAGLIPAKGRPADRGARGLPAEFGPCRLWVLGDGPEWSALAEPRPP